MQDLIVQRNFTTTFTYHKMKKKLFLLIFSVSFVLVANAKIWRVNNNGFAANFTTLALAVADNTVQNGDIIYLEGSSTAYGSVTLKKKLTIIGPGYNLSTNPNASVNVLSATLSDITFSPGSEGSILTGVVVNGGYSISINASSITIKRCAVAHEINFSYNISDIKILQNYFYNVYNYSDTDNLIGTSGYGFPSDVIFDNNICERKLVLPDNYTVLECKNNVFNGPAIAGQPSLKMLVGSFQNNILTSASAIANINNSSNINASYNISSSATSQFGTANNNIVISSGIFVTTTGLSSDGKYQLAAGSAGSANGSDGTDRGAFGGALSNRYTLSGLPAVPVIYQVITSGVTTTTTLPVTIKARVIN